jgi:membrane associated rhomboid family serine protease
LLDVEGDEVDGPAQPTAAELGFEPDGTAKQRDAELAEFRARLAALTPRVVVTPILVGLNVLVFAVMVARGVSPIEPSVDDLLAWGANQERLVAAGQGWRLVTSMFLHIGVVHLLMNMWVLWGAGRLVERMFGPVAFAAAYLLAGLAGSCASALWSPDRVSAGASGAIFGVFGLLGAFLLRQRRVLPPGALRGLGRSAVVVVGYNVIYGVTKPNIDMAAHLGGLAGGFLAGLPLARALTPEARAGAGRRAGAVMVAGLVALAGVVAAASRLAACRARASLVARELPGASISFPAGADRRDHLDYEYDNGGIRVDLADTGYVELGWRTGAMSSDAELRTTDLAPVLDAIGGLGLTLSVAEEISVAGGKGLWYVLRDAHGRITQSFSTWPCRKRVFNLIAAGSGVALEPSLRGSFRCKPDLARDGKKPLPNVELSLGPDFGLVDSSSFLAFQSLDGELIFVTRFPASNVSDDADVDAIVRRFLVDIGGKTLGISALTVAARAREGGPGAERAVWRGVGRRDGKPVRVLAVEIRCDPRDYQALYLGPAAFPETRALAPLLDARCTAHPAEPPLIADLAKAACAGGDKRACTLKLEK